MANKTNGHWYTDKNGQHYFVENGQSPKEGWEASKRRKMLDGGKYKVSEDGVEYHEVEKDEYDAFEADDKVFDENVDDDFGFDEEEEDQRYREAEYAMNGEDDNKDGDWEEEPEYRVERIAEDIKEYVGENDLERIKNYCKRYEEDYDEVINKVAQHIEAGEDPTDSVEAVLDDIVNGAVGSVPESDSTNDEEEFKKIVNSADDDVLDEQFGKDTPERKLVGAMKDKPTGMSEWDKKHQDFLEKGKSTWNQKLQKGDKISIKDKDGNLTDVYIGGFYRDGEVVDEDTYEEGKDNNWHDFRGVYITDKDGKPLGSINAYQIQKHSRAQTSNNEKSALMKERDELWDKMPDVTKKDIERLIELRKLLGDDFYGGK